MLRPQKEFEILARGMGRYHDPQLDNRTVLLQLCMRLHIGGMLVATTNVVDTVDFFAFLLPQYQDGRPGPGRYELPRFEACSDGLTVVDHKMGLLWECKQEIWE